MGVIKDLSNSKYGRLNVISYAFSKNRRAYWNCICDCGNEITVASNQLHSGKTKSCGCLVRDVNNNKYRDYSGIKVNQLTFLSFSHRENYITFWLCKCDCGNKKIVNASAVIQNHITDCGCRSSERHRKNASIHNGSKTRLFRIWTGLRNRYSNPNNKDWSAYGGRGISFCENWNNFESFRDWALKNGYNDFLTIDRINVNGNYEPSNCRWVSIKEQNNNKRSNVFIIINGETHTTSEWSSIKGLKCSTVKSRIALGWNPEKAILTPVLRGGKK